jgi:hypothetical protein
VIRTPILEGGRYGRVKYDLDPKRLVERFERLRPMDAASFARRVVRAVERNRLIIIEPWWWRLFWVLDRLSPRLGQKLVERLFHEMQRDFEALRRA